MQEAFQVQVTLAPQETRADTRCIRGMEALNTVDFCAALSPTLLNKITQKKNMNGGQQKLPT